MIRAGQLHVLRAVLLGTLSTGLAGCDKPAIDVVSVKTSAVGGISTPDQAQIVAKAIARAMENEEIRLIVRNAMRRSQHNEHKLVLQDFVRSTQGARLLSAAASSLGMTQAQMTNMVAGLPALDFYVSFETHRLTWEGTAEILVATTFDPDAPVIIAYGAHGQEVALEKDKGVPARPLVIIHPAEPKSARAAPQVDVAGNVIQESTDPVVNSKYVAGQSNLFAPSFEALPKPSATNVLASDTYINHFNIQEGDGWFGNSEMQFHSFAISNYQGFLGGANAWYLVADTCPLGSYYRNDVVEDRGYDGLFLLSPGVYNVNSLAPCNGAPAFYGVHIIEIDGGGTGEDDDFGWRLYQAGAYPFGATVGSVYSFYANTLDNTRTAYLRIAYN